MRIALFFTLLLSSLVAFAADKATEVFTLDHQMSQHCEKRIKENLRFEKGISKIDVSLKENTITVTYDKEKTDSEKIIKGFKKIGFNAFIMDCEPTKQSDGCAVEIEPGN
ncbi:MAG: heavy-metal-associated domain-containing protein [Bacteroidales bacterium]|nr:heavy-metal-associated domain-containing protein [Bacteroidales bacterium]